MAGAGDHGYDLFRHMRGIDGYGDRYGSYELFMVGAGRLYVYLNGPCIYLDNERHLYADRLRASLQHNGIDTAEGLPDTGADHQFFFELYELPRHRNTAACTGKLFGTGQ